VGNYCVFAGQSGVVGHIRIGDGVQVAAQSGVTGDVPSGMQVGGSPAVPLAEARRAWMAFSHLPQLRTAVRRLTKELAALKKRLGYQEDSPSCPQEDEP
jgi:UDP-3-O-[3-hydroxymyristoyl] glucosamine N-acyltransferase